MSDLADLWVRKLCHVPWDKTGGLGSMACLFQWKHGSLALDESQQWTSPCLVQIQLKKPIEGRIGDHKTNGFLDCPVKN